MSSFHLVTPHGYAKKKKKEAGGMECCAQHSESVTWVLWSILHVFESIIIMHAMCLQVRETL